jgi:hypothetical protein
VCVAALCTLQKDLLHAGYLAITLLLFRQRHKLLKQPAAAAAAVVTNTASSSNNGPAAAGRGAGSSSSSDLLMWLPLFNFFVIAATLAYQVCAERSK